MASSTVRPGRETRRSIIVQPESGVGVDERIIFDSHAARAATLEAIEQQVLFRFEDAGFVRLIAKRFWLEPWRIKAVNISAVTTELLFDQLNQAMRLYPHTFTIVDRKGAAIERIAYALPDFWKLCERFRTIGELLGHQEYQSAAAVLVEHYQEPPNDGQRHEPSDAKAEITYYPFPEEYTFAEWSALLAPSR